MTDAGVGQSTCVGIGGDPIIGTTFLDVLQLFAADDRRPTRSCSSARSAGRPRRPPRPGPPSTCADIPKVAFIAGRTAPEGKRMGHAGAIISRRRRDGGIQGRRRSRRPASASPARRPSCRPCSATPATAADGERRCRPVDIRFLFDYDRWATRAASSTPPWASTRRPGRPTNVVDERGLGGILVHHLGAPPALAPRPDRRRRRAPRPEDEPLLDLDALRDARGSASGPATTPGSMAWTDAWLDADRRGHRVLADAGPRREPRDAAPVGGGGPADGRSATPRATST